MHVAQQLSVQQQNENLENSIRKTVTYWRSQGVPEALMRVGAMRGIDWKKSIVIDLEIDFPGMPALFGRLVSQDQRFIEFEIDTVDGIQIECWNDVTDAYNFSQHNRGIGVGMGALVLKVFQDFDTGSAQ